MAENFSENVVRLLAKDWKHIADLERIVGSDRNFRRFVLNHIDATTDANDLRAIVSNSHNRCRTTNKQLCGAVEDRAKSALKEQADISH